MATQYTTMNVGLSPLLLSHVKHGVTDQTGNGVYVYAFAFQGKTLTASANLIANGTPTGQNSLALTSAANPTFSSGSVAFVIQQTSDSISPIGPSITAVGDLVLHGPSTAADTNNYRYDFMEVSLTGAGPDVADLTNIVQFGAPMEIEVVYQTTTPGVTTSDTRGFNRSGALIEQDLTAMSPSGIQNQTFNPVPAWYLPAPAAPAPTTELRDAIVPGNNLVPNPIPGDDWTNYVNAFKSAVGDVKIAINFFGSPFQPTPMMSDYRVEYDLNDGTTGAFWLVPVTNQGGSNTDYIRITTSDLLNKIYLQKGSLEVHAGSKTGPLVTTGQVPDVSFTPNTATGAVAKYFVAGFDAGFWGATGNPANIGDRGTLDLSKTWNWNANYAYGAILNPALGYSQPLNTGPNPNGGTPGGNNRFYDPYAAEFFKYSNAYGYSYTDLISNGGGINPGISVYDTAASANVETINVTLYDLADTALSGYKTSNNGILGGPTYSAASAFASANLFQFDFHFGGLAGGATWQPSGQTPITFRFYNPTDTTAADGFVSLTVPSGDWYSLTLQNTPTNPKDQRWAFVNSGGSGLAGFFSITGVPVTSDGTPAWYQLQLGDTLYNMYATVDGSNNFVTTVADHGVTITPTGTTQEKFVFANSGVFSFDPATINPGSPAGDHRDLLLQNGQVLGDWQMRGTPAPVLWNQLGAPLGAGWLVVGTGDFNADGQREVLLQSGQQVAEYGAGNVGTLNAGWIVAGTGDLNGDGHTDILLQNGTQVAAWLMNGTVIMGGSGPIGTAGPGWSVTGTADFNGDGNADILLQSGQQLATWLMNGTTILGGSGPIGTLGVGWVVAGTNDLDGDGKGDILLQNGQQIAEWQMDGTTIAWGGDLGTIGPGWVVAGTVKYSNTDGYGIVQLQNVALLSEWKITGHAVTSDGTIGTMATGVVVAATGNFTDREGHSDILMQNGQQIAEWQVNGTSITWDGNIGTLGTGWAVAGTADFNGDGHKDILLQNGLQVAEWQMNGQAITWGGNLGTLAAGYTVAGTGDFNGDGHADVLLQKGQQLDTWLLNGQSIIGGGILGTMATGQSVAGTGDFDGDGHSDILLQAGQQFAEWQVSGGTTVAWSGTVGTVGAGWTAAGTGDFNGDGHCDILLQNGQTLAEWQMNGQSIVADGTIGTLGTGWSVAGTGHFNTDGHSDILLQNGQQVAEWLMNGTTIMSGSGNVGVLGEGWLLI